MDKTQCFYCGEHFPHADILPDLHDTYICEGCDVTEQVSMRAYRKRVWERNRMKGFDK